MIFITYIIVKLHKTIIIFFYLYTNLFIFKNTKNITVIHIYMLHQHYVKVYLLLEDLTFTFYKTFKLFKVYKKVRHYHKYI